MFTKTNALVYIRRNYACRLKSFFFCQNVLVHENFRKCTQVHFRDLGSAVECTSEIKSSLESIGQFCRLQSGLIAKLKTNALL